MGVQIRIPGPGVAMGERRGHEAADVDLPDPVPALPGEQSVPFDEAEGILHRGLMREFDLRSEVRVGDRPQGRHRLDRGEGQVIADNGLSTRARPLSNGGDDLAGIDRIAAMLCSEELRATSVRIRARSAAEIGSARSCPAAACRAAICFATSMRKG